jgi:hypothetical protein
MNIPHSVRGSPRLSMVTLRWDEAAREDADIKGTFQTSSRFTKKTNPIKARFKH